MKPWVRAIVSTPGAAEDFKHHLDSLIASEGSLDIIRTLDQLHTARGKLEAFKLIRLHVTNAQEKKP